MLQLKCIEKKNILLQLKQPKYCTRLDVPVSIWSIEEDKIHN